MWVDIIVLSILSALTSGPLVIWRQMKALDHRFDFNVGQILLVLLVGILVIGISAVIFIIVLEPYNPHDEILAVNIVLLVINILFLMVSVGILMGLVIWLFTAVCGT